MHQREPVVTGSPHLRHAGLHFCAGPRRAEHFEKLEVGIKRDKGRTEVMAKRVEECRKRFCCPLGLFASDLKFDLPGSELRARRLKFSDEIRLRPKRKREAIDELLHLLRIQMHIRPGALRHWVGVVVAAEITGGHRSALW